MQTTNRITVAVRVRPLNEREVSQSHRVAAEVIPSRPGTVHLSKNERFNAVLASQRAETHEYGFDFAFGPQATSKEVYETTTKSMVRDVLGGTNCTVFAYGATSAGKTHTMLGTPNDPGIIPRAMMDLFHQASALTATTGKNVTLRASFLEIYNETIRDLLSDREKVLNPCEEEATGVVRVLGITERKVENLSEIMSLLLEGSSRRKTEPTAVNQVSSRSHAILQVSVMVTNPTSTAAAGTKRDSWGESRGGVAARRHTLAACDSNAAAVAAGAGGAGAHHRVVVGKSAKSVQQPGLVHMAKLSLIDLAGSERAANTNNTGARLREGASINRSLLALANCINALSSGGRVKYRDSKLTHVLKSSLDPTSGNTCRVTMIAAVTPSHRSFEESMNTLKYAARAKEIVKGDAVVPAPPPPQPQQPLPVVVVSAPPHPLPLAVPAARPPTTGTGMASRPTVTPAFFLNELEAKLRAVEAERDSLRLQLTEARAQIARMESSSSSLRPHTKRGKSEAGGRMVTIDPVVIA